MRKYILYGLFCSIMVALAISHEREIPDVIYFNGQLITMEESLPAASAIALKDGMILAVGDDAEILGLQDETTTLIDLDGRALMPGFVDAHTHLFNDAGYWDSNIDDIQDLAVRNGITSLANLYSYPEFIQSMEELAGTGKLRIRTSLYVILTSNCGDIQPEWYRDYRLNRSSDSMLRILGVKIFADGGSCGRPAISFEYNDTGGHGDLFLSQEFLNESVSQIDEAGFQVAIHAQGDLAVEQALNAIEFALEGRPNLNRHRIEHNAYVREDQLPRYSEIGIVPIIFGSYSTCRGIRDGRYAEVFGADQLDWLENWRRFLDANPDLVISWHGDDPGVPPVSPILELYSYVTRNEVLEDSGEVCEAPDWLKQSAITVEEALELMTMGSAYALFMEDAVGSLRPGKYADLLILSESPLAVDSENIKDIEILMTMIGGVVAYCAPQSPLFCSPSNGNNLLNIARGKPVVASKALPGFAPEMAVDGDLETWWGAGDFAPQEIEIDLEAAGEITSLRLLPSQSPEGITLHRVWAKSSPEASYRLIREISDFTQDLEWLEVQFETPITDVRFIKISTISSPSWVAWREIEVY